MEGLFGRTEGKLSSLVAQLLGYFALSVEVMGSNPTQWPSVVKLSSILRQVE